MIHLNPTLFESLSEAERDAVFRGHDELSKDLAATGELVGSAALAEPANTKTVRVRGGVPAVTDGPYIEAKEHLAGYYVIDCDTVERATEIATRIPDATLTAVEVRPVMNASGLEM
jgi:hypothetical protein